MTDQIDLGRLCEGFLFFVFLFLGAHGTKSEVRKGLKKEDATDCFAISAA